MVCPRQVSQGFDSFRTYFLANGEMNCTWLPETGWSISTKCTIMKPYFLSLAVYASSWSPLAVISVLICIMRQENKNVVDWRTVNMFDGNRCAFGSSRASLSTRVFSRVNVSTLFIVYLSDESSSSSLLHEYFVLAFRQLWQCYFPNGDCSGKTG